MPQPPYYEVDVPIRNTELSGRTGVHVFTGWADSRAAAVQAAHDAHDAAHNQRSGLREPARFRRRPLQGPGSGLAGGTW